MKRYGLLPGVLLLASGACDSVTGPELTSPCVSWCNTVAPWPHDGQPYEGENFIVYSDGASLQARKDLVTIAETVLASVRAQLGIDSEELLTLPPGQTKIHLYAYKYHYQPQWGAQAFWGGLIIFSLDHPKLSREGYTEVGHYTRLMTHELVHVVQNMLVGSSHSYSTHTWFEEGLAEFVSELNPQHRIRTLSDLNARVAVFGALNPIEIHNDILPDIPNVGVEYFYPMFELTMGYLLSTRGMGRTLHDVRDVFLDMRDGLTFPVAFEAHFGVSVSLLASEFFTRIRAFLQ